MVENALVGLPVGGGLQSQNVLLGFELDVILTLSHESEVPANDDEQGSQFRKIKILLKNCMTRSK